MMDRHGCITVTEKDWENASADQRGWWTYQTLQSLSDRLSKIERRPFHDKAMAFIGGVIGGFLAALGIKYLGH